VNQGRGRVKVQKIGEPTQETSQGALQDDGEGRSQNKNYIHMCRATKPEMIGNLRNKQVEGCHYRAL
jgi:hypothetical protein